MQKAERQQELLRIARDAGGFARLTTLAERTGVSLITLRRDADDLANAGLVTRTHGGLLVTERDSLTLEPSFMTRSHIAETAKASIAKAAAALVAPGSTIAIDTGTTTLEFSKALRQIDDLKIITSSLVVASTCADRHSVYMLGGRVRPGELSVIGTSVQDDLRNFQVDQAFLGVAGITNTCGDYSFEDALVKRGLISHASQAIVLADSTKFGRRASAVICPVDQVDLIITEASPREEGLTQLGDVELLITNQ